MPMLMAETTDRTKIATHAAMLKFFAETPANNNPASQMETARF
jgi:hypothetical protein